MKSDKKNSKRYLEISPKKTLKLCGSFTNVIKKRIVLRNISGQSLRFKIKTTAPTFYRVEPNAGVMETREILYVNVDLLPFQYDRTKNYNHKFKVFSVVATSLNDTNDWETKEDPSYCEHKIFCKLKFVQDGIKTPSERVAKSVNDKIIFVLRDGSEIIEESNHFGQMDTTRIACFEDTQSLISDVESQNAHEGCRLSEEFVMANNDKPVQYPSQVCSNRDSVADVYNQRPDWLDPASNKDVSASPVIEWKLDSKLWPVSRQEEKDWAVEYIRSTSSVPPMIYLLIAFFLGSVFGIVFL